ncbi:MAG: cysteine desulfurase [Cyclobacteriaceae bacterium]
MDSTTSLLNVRAIREQFPVLHQNVNGKPLVYFDNAATSQTPNSVIKALSDYYSKDNANIHRGIHTLAERATTAYEETRIAAQAFINSREKEEIIFTKGTTEGLNLIAQSYGRKFLKEGDEIIVSEMEHHSNIVPWQMLCQQTGAKLKVIPVTDEGEINMEGYRNLLSEKTKIVSIVYISNSLGTINPVKEMGQMAHDVGAIMIVDGAQAAPHGNIDVKDLNCDFLAMSAHKMYGTTGVGLLYGKRSLLEKMDPYQGGGEMINEVSFSGTTYNDIPYKFEAGTPNIADVIALKKAMDFMHDVGISNLQAYETELLNYGTEQLNQLDGFIPVGVAKKKASVISFNIEGIHPFDIGMWLDAKGIAVRTGHHCTQPLMDRLQIEGTVRASFAVYNTVEEIDILKTGLEEIIKKFR